MPTGIKQRFGPAPADWDAAVKFAHAHADDEDHGTLNLVQAAPVTDPGHVDYWVVSDDQLSTLESQLGNGFDLEIEDRFRHDGDGLPR